MYVFEYNFSDVALQLHGWIFIYYAMSRQQTYVRSIIYIILYYIFMFGG